MKSWFLLPLRALRGVGRIPPSDLAILSEAGLFLALARVAVAVVPFRLLVRRFGRPVEPAHGSDFVPARLLVFRVRWAVLAVAARAPLSSPCLPQAIAAKLMLSRRGVPTTIHLGVKNPSTGALAAHAWLSAGPIVVTGKAGHRSFTEVARFA